MFDSGSGFSAEIPDDDPRVTWISGPPSDDFAPLTVAELMGEFTPSEIVHMLTPSELLGEIERFPPTGRLLGFLQVLDPDRLTDAERVRALRLWERHAAWADAQQQRWITAIAGEQKPPSGDDWAALEVGAALRLSPSTAEQRVFIARSLTLRFTRILALMERGDVTWLHAKTLAEATRHLDDEAARAVETLVLRKAPRQTVGEFRSSVRVAVLAVDTQCQAQRHAAARAQRRLTFEALEDGMARIEAILPADDAVTVWRALDQHARRARLEDPADPRGLDALRADSLSAICAQVLTDPALPTSHGRPVTTAVTMDAATLLGLADNPAMLDGYGPISASFARELASNSQWRLLITDAVDGRLITLGTRTYRPTPLLRDFVVARDRTCRFPNCNRAAYWCDIDHRHAYDHDDPTGGGATDEDNCELLCERHHRAKHETCWRVDLIVDAEVGSQELEWTSPAGVKHRVAYPDLRPPQFYPRQRPAPDRHVPLGKNLRSRPIKFLNDDPPF